MDQKNCLAMNAGQPEFADGFGQFFLRQQDRLPSFLLFHPAKPVYRGLTGRRDWTRTNDPHHVKVVL
jgi:hypothetical protein